MNGHCATLFAAFFGGSFVMHLAWENAQMPLFELADPSFWPVFKMCLFATVTGDMLFMLVLNLTMTVIHKDFCWLKLRIAYAHPATWTIPILVGVLLAVSFELWAVHAVHRWRYGSMPLIPFIHVGITPVLQMIVIPLATTALCHRVAIRLTQTRVDVR